jgi:RNA recognition motif-containing protein
MGKKLYVGSLPFSATEESLRDLFSSIGEVESVSVITDRDTGRSKGFGFVEMSSAEDAKKAIEELNGKTFMERALVVNEARPQQPRQGRGSGGGRGGFGGGRGSGYGRDRR